MSNNNSNSNSNARANSNNSGSNNNATNRRTGGVVARARAGRERVAAEVNHMRTLNTRLATLQGRYNRLIDPSFTGAGVAQWNSLGNQCGKFVPVYPKPQSREVTLVVRA